MRLNIGPSGGSNQNVRTVLKVDKIYVKDNDMIDMLNARLDKVEELEAKVLSLENKIDEVLDMMKAIWYAPGMPGYQQAETNFNELTSVATDTSPPQD